MKNPPKIMFMGMELFGRDVGGPNESWHTRPKKMRPKKGETIYPLICVGKDVNGNWYTVATFMSRGINIGGNNPRNPAPSRRAALERLRNAILLAADELKPFMR